VLSKTSAEIKNDENNRDEGPIACHGGCSLSDDCNKETLKNPSIRQPKWPGKHFFEFSFNALSFESVMQYLFIALGIVTRLLCLDVTTTTSHQCVCSAYNHMVCSTIALVYDVITVILPSEFEIEHWNELFEIEIQHWNELFEIIQELFKTGIQYWEKLLHLMYRYYQSFNIVPMMLQHCSLHHLRFPIEWVHLNNLCNCTVVLRNKLSYTVVDVYIPSTIKLTPHTFLWLYEQFQNIKNFTNTGRQTSSSNGNNGEQSQSKSSNHSGSAGASSSTTGGTSHGSNGKARSTSGSGGSGSSNGGDDDRDGDDWRRYRRRNAIHNSPNFVAREEDVEGGNENYSTITSSGASRSKKTSHTEGGNVRNENYSTIASSGASKNEKISHTEGGNGNYSTIASSGASKNKKKSHKEAKPILYELTLLSSNGLYMSAVSSPMMNNPVTGNESESPLGFAASNGVIHITGRCSFEVSKCHLYISCMYVCILLLKYGGKVHLKFLNI